VYGSTNGFFFPPAVGDEADLAADDADLYNYVQDAYGVLPIELVYFNATLVNQEVRLTWATASEVNNDHFIIERSQDGIHFEFLQYLSGAGNSKIEQRYEVFDPYPINGRSYYRLGQVDYDGNSSDFFIATVFNSSNDSFEIYPNPTTDFLYFSKRCLDCSITLGDSHGRFAPENIEIVETSNGKVGVDLRGLESGIYIIQLLNPETLASTTFRVVKE
jgi:hypothetical protein